MMNNSTDNIAEHFDTRYVVQEISKIPSIFGRRNNVARKVDKKVDKEDHFKSQVNPKNIKGDDIELHIMPGNHQENRKDSLRKSKLN